MFALMKIMQTLFSAGFIVASFYSWSQKKETIIALVHAVMKTDRKTLAGYRTAKAGPLDLGVIIFMPDSGDTLNLKARYAKQKSDQAISNCLKLARSRAPGMIMIMERMTVGKYWPHKDEIKLMTIRFLGFPKSNPV